MKNTDPAATMTRRKRVSETLRDAPASSRVQTSFYMDPDMHRRLKIRAVHEECSMADLIRRVISDYLDREDA